MKNLAAHEPWQKASKRSKKYCLRLHFDFARKPFGASGTATAHPVQAR